MNDLATCDAKLLAVRGELQTAGPIHRRDLLRQIKRLQRKRRALARQQAMDKTMRSAAACGTSCDGEYL